MATTAGGIYRRQYNDKKKGKGVSGRDVGISVIPEEEPAVEAPVEAPKKQGFMSRLMDKAKEPNATGVSKGRRFMEYLLPTLMSMSGGAGALPGLLTGMSIGTRRQGQLADIQREGLERQRKAKLERGKFDLNKKDVESKIEHRKMSGKDSSKYFDARARIQEYLDAGRLPNKKDEDFVKDYERRYFSLSKIESLDEDE